MNFEIGIIPEDRPRGWGVNIDGVEEYEVGRIEITSKFGTLTYG
jgi:hypothetical protein